MEKNLVTLAALILKNLFDDMAEYMRLMTKIRQIVTEEPKNIDPLLELKLGLHTYYYKIIQASGESLFPAADALFNDPHYHSFLQQQLRKWMHSTEKMNDGWLFSKHFEKDFEKLYEDKMKPIARFIVLNTMYDACSITSTPTPAAIIRAFYGLKGDTMLSFQDIQATMKFGSEKQRMSIERIRDINTKTLKKVDEAIQEMGIEIPTWH